MNAPLRTLRPQLGRGDLLALLGVAIFAGTYPATRLAMLGGVSPWQNAAWRAAGAGLLALVLLRMLGATRPAANELPRLAVVAGTLGLIFPLGIALALQHVPASHAAILAAALPLTTVGYARLRGFDHPAPRFWIAGGVAALLVAGFAWRHGHDHAQMIGSTSATWWSYALLIMAFAGAAVGYVEGGQATMRRPGWQVISWALVLWLPVTIPVSAWLAASSTTLTAISIEAWIAVLYSTLGSMYLGFFPWYAAMERVGIARVSQWQYLQPFVAIGYGMLLLNERIDLLDGILALAVIATIAWGRSYEKTRKTGVS